MRGELDWSEMMVEWVLIESLSRYPLCSGCGSRYGLCIYWVLGMFQGLEGSGKMWGLG